MREKEHRATWLGVFLPGTLAAFVPHGYGRHQSKMAANIAQDADMAPPPLQARFVAPGAPCELRTTIL